MTDPQIYSHIHQQALGDPRLAMALATMFLLTASMVGGIGRMLVLAAVSYRLARLGIVTAMIATASSYFL